MAHKVCVANKTEDLNLSVFNIITEIKEWKTFIKHILCKCKCKFDGRKCNSDQWWNKDKCWCECKKCHEYEKDYILNPSTCSCENGKYIASIIDDLEVTWDEVIESYYNGAKNIAANLNEKEGICKTQDFYTLPAFLFITIALLIAISIYCCLKKYLAKQKHLMN